MPVLLQFCRRKQFFLSTCRFFLKYWKCFQNNPIWALFMIFEFCFLFIWDERTLNMAFDFTRRSFRMKQVYGRINIWLRPLNVFKETAKKYLAILPRAVRSFFNGGRVGGWVNMLATMADQGRKLLKLHWIKHPKIVQKKRILDQKILDSKPHIWSLLISDFQIECLKANNN